ncbi:MAG: stage II sporulation protein M [Thermoanaerobaculia bacterium]|nr:stage II sporulation protein M [Thermoanaerobaculia bacterium]
MDYRRFVEMREPACDEFKDLLDRAERSPRRLGHAELERLSVLYRQLLHDHSLAAARFPGTGMARRLRRLVLEGTHFLQADTGESLPRLGRFIGHTFPVTLRRLAPDIGIALALFAVAALFGFTLTTMEPALASTFLPLVYLEGLEQGKLWTESIFAIAPGSILSGQIATNNLSVALTAWAGGALAGLGSLWVTLFNGLMLGSVFAATARYGLADRLFEFIAAHGPLELSLIIVSAGAGLHLGRAMISAGDEPRGQRLRKAAIDSLLVVLGCLPWILVLGFVEGYISPRDEIDASAKLVVGLLLEAAFLAWAVLPGRKVGAAP